MTLLSSREFAARLGVQPETVRKWVRKGRIPPPAVRLPPRRDGKPGQLRFTEAQVEEAIRLHSGAPELSERAQDIEAHVLAARARLKIVRQAQ